MTNILPSSQVMAQEQSQSLAEEALHSREAFAQLYAIHAPPLFRYFWFHTRSRPLAEDLVSETFLTVLNTLGTFSAGRGLFAGWLYGIARHTLARHRRKRNAAEQADRASIETAGQVLSSDERIDLWQAVGELSSMEREVIALKFGAGLTHKEIAGVTSLREAHVGVVLYRALQQLRARLVDTERDHHAR